MRGFDNNEQKINFVSKYAYVSCGAFIDLAMARSMYIREIWLSKFKFKVAHAHLLFEIGNINLQWNLTLIADLVLLTYIYFILVESMNKLLYVYIPNKVKMSQNIIIILKC